MSFFVCADLPDEKPRITGIKEKYQIGETLEALCTSWQSHPPANLTWFINEEPVSLPDTHAHSVLFTRRVIEQGIGCL
jgi:hypothetical protein